MRADAFKGERYQITHEKDGHLNLMRNAVFADWDFPWHDLDIPTLVSDRLSRPGFLCQSRRFGAICFNTKHEKDRF